jgi:signal transduction histidine kinase/ligand-binding sensor domain-containing protein/DNA-binding response OmpR family regulator
MNPKYYICLLTALFITLSISTGANPAISPNRITSNPIPVINQFTSNTVRRILQDKDGFLWFGTLDGLYRYDGYRVLTFRSDLNNPDLLANNEITSLEEDKNNHIWIGTREGLNLLDRETFKITPFTNSIIQKQFIQALRCTSDGKVWIALDGNAYYYNPADGSFKSAMDNFSHPRGGINYIYEDYQGDIWVLMWNSGIHRFKKDGTIVHYPQIGTRNNPFRIYQDDKKQYWICTWGDGVFRFHPNNNPESTYEYYPVITKGEKPTENVFYSIVQDDFYHYIWLMSLTGIHALRYTDKNTIEQVDISYLFKKSNNIFSEITKDKKGNLWIAGFDEGAFSINFDKPTIQNLEMNEIRETTGMTPNINAILLEEDELWMNQTRIGLSFYNLHTNKFRNYQDIPALKHISNLSNLTSIEKISNGEIWLGTTDISWLYIVEKKGKKIILKKTVDLGKEFDAGGAVKKIFEDSKNNIWIVTNTCVLIKPYNQTQIRVFSKDLRSITDIAEDNNGRIWLSRANKGIYCIELNMNSDLADSQITNYTKSSHQLPSDNIVAICCDLDGDVWFGAQEGNIILYNNYENSFTDYTQQCSMTGEAIQNMITDNKNNIWITTNKRVVEYNKTFSASRDYSSSDRLIVNSFLPGSCYFDQANDVMYFGGNQGICQFSSFNFEQTKKKDTQVIISDVKIDGQSLLNGAGSDKFLTISQKLTLSPEDKNIEIDFTSLDYTYPEKIIYAYKTDKNWIYTHHRFITFNRLNKGNNVLQIKATDENRIWSSNIKTLNIYKNPAFYETWWAYIIYMLISASIVWWLYRTTRNRMRLKQELQIAQIEKDKSEELTQTKLRYFTNISHDLLTPLTIISCLIDDTETVIKQKISQFGMMRANVNRLKRLLQQVLDFRKMESGNMKLRVTQGELSTFIRHICLDNFIPLFEKKRIAFSYESESDHIPGYFDADKIDKTLYNLISNALKYTPENGKIEVAVKVNHRNEQRFACITVKDTGVGISPEDIPYIFTRFYNNKHIEAMQTNGIGLSLTRDLIELHHGIISVESKLNTGTVFIIEIPIDNTAFAKTEIDNDLPTIMETNVSGSNDEESYQPFLPEDFSPDKNINLLLVEDNEDILFMLKNILQKHYNILTATNGQLALDIIQDNDVDIIISDVMMPEMDGLELCRKIKADIGTSHISVLLLTAKNSIEDRIECYDAGADGYISKPFDMKLLQARISNFIIGRQKKQAKFKSDIEINTAILNYPSRDEEFLNKAIATIEEYLTDANFDINSFAAQMNMSKSTLYRKIKTMTSLSPNELIRNIRLKHGYQLMKDKSRTVSEVAYAVGFSDPRYFATCFKAAFGTAPKEFQRNVMD